MKVVKSLKEISQDDPQVKFVLTIGNFDGVHVGHQKFLSLIRERCEAEGIKFILVTFIPHPVQVLKPRGNFLINTYMERRDLLEKHGVDYLCEIDFSRDLSTRDPKHFLDEHIFNALKVETMYLGHDFAFGANKSGDLSFVQNYCSEKKIDLQVQEPYLLQEKLVSSTLVRRLVKQGDVEQARELLDREFYITGNIVKGAGRGREIGYPTANLKYSDLMVVPMEGVYATKTLYNGRLYCSVTNIGTNPTFNQEEAKLTVETHILGFEKDIYGDDIQVHFFKRIRDEKRFNTSLELIAQIKSDTEIVTEYFGK